MAKEKRDKKAEKQEQPKAPEQARHSAKETPRLRTKFGKDIVTTFADGWGQLQNDGFLTVANGNIELTRAGLLQVDRLLPAFFEAEHRGTRYT